MALKRRSGGGRKATSIPNTLKQTDINKVWFDDLLVGVVRSFRAEETNTTPFVNVTLLKRLYDTLETFTTAQISEELNIPIRHSQKYLQVIDHCKIHIDRSNQIDAEHRDKLDVFKLKPFDTSLLMPFSAISVSIPHHTTSNEDT